MPQSIAHGQRMRGPALIQRVVVVESTMANLMNMHHEDPNLLNCSQLAFAVLALAAAGQCALALPK